MQTLVEKKNVILFPLPKQIDDIVIENIKGSIEKTKTCILSQNASVSLSETAKLQIHQLSLSIEKEV